MKREIKFRGKRIDGGGWVYGGYFYDNIRDIHYIRVAGDKDTFMNLAIEVIPETVGQFTGLKDKNLKEIYEGDIIQYDYGNPLRMSIPNPKIREVAFIDGAFVTKDDEYHYSMPIHTPLFRHNKNCKVIGNIYENPDLLNP